MDFVDHIPQEQYPAGLQADLYIASGVRGWKEEPCLNKGMKMVMKPCQIWSW